MKICSCTECDGCKFLIKEDTLEIICDDCEAVFAVLPGGDNCHGPEEEDGQWSDGWEERGGKMP